MYTADGVLLRDCKFINEAKRFSRQLQSLGNVVRVDRKDDPVPVTKRRGLNRSMRPKVLPVDSESRTRAKITVATSHNWTKGGTE